MDNGNKNGKITIGDVADALGISKTTVSRAISGKGRIGEETRRKVQEYITEHNYTPNVYAKGLAQSKTFNIGVVLPADQNLIEQPFFQGCLIGVTESAAAADYDVVVTTSTESDISLIKRLVDNRKVDGILLTRTLRKDNAVKYLKQSGIPFAVIGSVEDDDIVQVDSNHVGCCNEMTSILFNCGCRRMAFFCGNLDYSVNKSRYEGFEKAYQEKKKHPDAKLVFSDLNTKAMIQAATDKVLQSGCDCILCADDIICGTVLARLNQKGVNIPGDIKVASFYNSVYLSNYNPPITAVNIDVRELGSVAASRLLELISSGETVKKTKVSYDIMMKKSTM